jgi:hypothetical protein
MLSGGIEDPSDFYGHMRGFTKKMRKCFPGATLAANMIVLPFAQDPVPEIVIVWSSQPEARAMLLSNAKYAGLGMDASDGGELEGLCFACTIIGDKGEVPDVEEEETHQVQESGPPLYIQWESDDEEGVIELANVTGRQDGGNVRRE